MSRVMKRAFRIEAGSPLFNSAAISDIGLAGAVETAVLAALIASFDMETIDCALEADVAAASLENGTSEPDLVVGAAFAKILLNLA